MSTARRIRDSTSYNSPAIASTLGRLLARATPAERPLQLGEVTHEVEALRDPLRRDRHVRARDRKLERALTRPLPKDAAKDEIEERVLAVDVVVEIPGGDAHLPRHLRHLCTAVAAAGKHDRTSNQHVLEAILRPWAL
jgi:hypothetical protein